VNEARGNDESVVVRLGCAGAVAGDPDPACDSPRSCTAGASTAASTKRYAELMALERATLEPLPPSAAPNCSSGSAKSRNRSSA